MQMFMTFQIKQPKCVPFLKALSCVGSCWEKWEIASFQNHLELVPQYLWQEEVCFENVKKPCAVLRAGYSDIFLLHCIEKLKYFGGPDHQYLITICNYFFDDSKLTQNDG